MRRKTRPLDMACLQTLQDFYVFSYTVQKSCQTGQKAAVKNTSDKNSIHMSSFCFKAKVKGMKTNDQLISFCGSLAISDNMNTDLISNF